MSAVVLSPDEIETRLRAMMFLAQSGWVATAKFGKRGSKDVEYFIAEHAHYPDQRADTVPDLVKKCIWQEHHRSLPAK
jgi:hypothetical protein